jgi:hypothetical protein
MGSYDDYGMKNRAIRRAQKVAEGRRLKAELEREESEHARRVMDEVGLTREDFMRGVTTPDDEPNPF